MKELKNTVELIRSSRFEVFCKKGVRLDFAKLTRKHLCRSFSFIKAASQRSTTVIKKTLWHRCFPLNFAKHLLLLGNSGGCFRLIKVANTPCRCCILLFSSSVVFFFYSRALFFFELHAVRFAKIRTRT